MTPNVTILQNQAHFSTAPYREHVTALADALQLSKFPKWTTRLHLESFWCGVLLYLCARRFNVVVSVSLLPSFAYGMMCRLFGKPKAIHVCKEFYLEYSVDNTKLMNKLRLGLLRFSLKNVDAVIVNASGESSYYSNILALPLDRFRFVAWPSNISEPEVVADDGGYFLAVGRSLRDWTTFFNAIKNTPFRYVVVAGEEDAKTFPKLDNVLVKAGVNRQDYLNILREARGVILPLKSTIRSTGQASFLEAMSYGKPVIASDVVGVHDYLHHEVNALLCGPKDAADLHECIMRIADDPVLRKQIALAGYHDIQTKFNKNRYAVEMLDVVTDLVSTYMFARKV